MPLIAPFTPLSTKAKAGIITGAIVFAEVMFWGGFISWKKNSIKV